MIDVDSFALQNCYEVNYQPKAGEVVALLNIGASTMNINITERHAFGFCARRFSRWQPVHQFAAERTGPDV